MNRFSLLLSFALVATAQNTATFDSRIRVSTYVREDLFSGFMVNDMARFEHGEKTLDELLALRPESRDEVLAWKAGAALYRAVRAQEQGNQAEFDSSYARAMFLFADAAASQNDPTNLSRQAITAGTLVLFADRLPEKYRAAKWATAYQLYSQLWKAQAPVVAKMPVHMRGELLAGLAQSAQRVGKTAESAEHLDRMLIMLRGTAYEAGARKWKESPDAAMKVKLTCLNCHDAGRLEPTRAGL